MKFIKRTNTIRIMQKSAAILTMLLTMMIASCENGTDCNINNVAYNRIQLYDAQTKNNVVADEGNDNCVENK